MTDALTTITKLINSPPGVLFVGGVWQTIATQFGLGLAWFYGVMKFFDAVGDRLNDDTKLQIRQWLLGRRKFEPKVQPWPATFARIFDRVFGTKHLSWTCFWRCNVISLTIAVAFMLFEAVRAHLELPPFDGTGTTDRKSTRLNSSHLGI